MFGFKQAQRGLQAGDVVVLESGQRTVAVEEFQENQTRGWWMEKDVVPTGNKLPGSLAGMWKIEYGDEAEFFNEEDPQLCLCPEEEVDDEAGPEEGPTQLKDVDPRKRISGLPTDDASRKGLPIFRGPLMYFPDALLAVAAVCKAGNDQHNPGEPLHWAREKSTEQLDTALRHMMDHGLGVQKDVDNTWHLAKAAWRILAELQLAIEKERGAE